MASGEKPGLSHALRFRRGVMNAAASVSIAMQMQRTPGTRIAVASMNDGPIAMKHSSRLFVRPSHSGDDINAAVT